MLGDVGRALDKFIKERIDRKFGMEKYPFLPQDKIKVYSDGILILTEMVALHRYLSKIFPQIGNPFKKEEAK